MATEPTEPCLLVRVLPCALAFSLLPLLPLDMREALLDTAEADCFTPCLPAACAVLAGGSGCVEVRRCVTAAALPDTPVGGGAFFSIDLGAGMLDAGCRVLLVNVDLAYDGMPVPLLSFAFGVCRRCAPPTLLRTPLGDLLGVLGEAGVLGGLSSERTGAAS